MTYKIFAPAVLALALAACGTTVQTPPGATTAAQTAPAAPAAPTATANAGSAENLVNAASIQALRDMGTFLQSLKRFHVSTSLTGEVVLADGQKLQHSAAADIDVQRPNKLRARMLSTRSERVIFFDGQHATMYLPQQKYYSTVDFPGRVDDLVKRLEERYGIQLPLSDLFLWGTAAAPLDKIDSAMNAGQDFIGNDLCNHFAFRQGNYDWQIWIATGSKPLPRKLVITNRADDARPQSVSLIDWNLSPTFKEDAFRFVPSPGTKPVELRALDAK